MPRAKIEAAFLGHYTLVALDAAPDAEAAWLIHTLCAWILRDELPKEVPPERAAIWNVVRVESELVSDSMKESATARSDAAREAAAARWRKRTDANACERMPTDANACVEMLESKKEIERENISEEKKNPSHAGAREVWLDDLTECPVPPDKLEVLAAHLELSPADLGAWKDYYTAQGWRRWPNSMRPMTPAAAEASLRFWKTKKGIEAEREAHIDAKMDERAEKRASRLRAIADPSRFAPPPEKGGIDTAALGI